MRDEDFPFSVKRQSLRRVNNRCERCLSSENLEFHHRVPLSLGGSSILENCVVLCENCHRSAPTDPFLFQELFMQFSSVKELLSHFNVDTEEAAIEAWTRDRGLDYNRIKELLERGSKRHSDAIRTISVRVQQPGTKLRFNPPFGYRYENGVLSLNQQEAYIVREIFERYLSGQPLTAIAQILNSQGIRTRNGSSWSAWSISYILRNPIYAGFTRWSGHISKSSHPALVSEEKFNRVQEMLVSKIRNPHLKYDPHLLGEAHAPSKQASEA